jgi:hypothetical protein
VNNSQIYTVPDKRKGICQILSSEGETNYHHNNVVIINLLASLYYQRKDKIGELHFHSIKNKNSITCQTKDYLFLGAKTITI